MRARLMIVVLLGTCLAGGLSSAPGPSAVDLLDRYAAGRFDAVVEALAAVTGFDDLLTELRRDGPKWIEARGPGRRASRELAAATLALEAARAGAWLEWRLTQRQPRMCPDCDPPLSILYWKAPPLLLEWGCALLRESRSPRPIERWWQLAALSVAQRSEDPQFLIGDTKIGRGVWSGEIGNIADEIKHLDHATARFPREMRFVLAQGIARDRDLPEDAVQVYQALEKDPDVGGEAMVRLGAMQLRRRSLPDALRNLERAEALTRDPYVIFLARYFKGQAFERQRQPERAEAAYRGAVAAVPKAQSATLALASLVFRNGSRAEAQRLVRDMLAADPPPLDPWRAYIHADDRFWPQLVGRLRAEILK
jgi:tetratricopeptide (TPR) repeat protein